MNEQTWLQIGKERHIVDGKNVALTEARREDKGERGWMMTA